MLGPFGKSGGSEGAQLVMQSKTRQATRGRGESASRAGAGIGSIAYGREGVAACEDYERSAMAQHVSEPPSGAEPVIRTTNSPEARPATHSEKKMPGAHSPAVED